MVSLLLLDNDMNPATNSQKASFPGLPAPDCDPETGTGMTDIVKLSRRHYTKPSDIKAEIDHIPVLHHVVLSLKADLGLLFGLMIGA